jgi:hypothetical protein
MAEETKTTELARQTADMAAAPIKGYGKVDSWANAYTNMGILGKDKRMSTFYQANAILPEGILTDLYRSNGLARRIVDLPAKEMTRAWLEIEGDSDGKMVAELERINARLKMREMLIWSRLYGGAVAVLITDDGQSLDAPLNRNGMRQVQGISVYHRFRCQWMESDLYGDPSRANYLTPQFYTIYPIDGRNSFRVHESRALRLDGALVPDWERLMNQGWGDSVLQSCYEELRRVGEGYADSEFILGEFITSVFGIKGFVSMLATRETAEEIKRRLELLDLSRHLLHAMMVDADGETYEKHASTITGVPELLDRFAQALAGVLGWPVTVLMGRSPAGLNATGESDIRNWYDMLAAEQEDKLTPLVRRLLQFLGGQKDGQGLKEFAEAKIIWKPLWQMTEKETADLRKTTAEADVIYVQNGILDADEVAQSRFGGDRWSAETTLDDEIRKTMKEEREKALQEMSDNPPQAVGHSSNATVEPVADEEKGFKRFWRKIIDAVEKE